MKYSIRQRQKQRLDFKDLCNPLQAQALISATNVTPALIIQNSTSVVTLQEAFAITAVTVNTLRRDAALEAVIVGKSISLSVSVCHSQTYCSH